MLRRVSSLVRCLGRAATYALGLAVLAGLLLGPVSLGLAATGNPLLLGKGNTAGKVTSLVANLAGPVLRLTNQGSGPALDLRVQDGPPLRVNSGALVANLNADTLDGKDATAFLAADGTAANAELLDGFDSSRFVERATDADTIFVDVGLVPANRCSTTNVPIDGVQVGSMVLLFPPLAFTNAGPLTFYTRRSDSHGQVPLVVCNIGATNVDPSQSIWGVVPLGG